MSKARIVFVEQPVSQVLSAEWVLFNKHNTSLKLITGPWKIQEGNRILHVYLKLSLH